MPNLLDPHSYFSRVIDALDHNDLTRLNRLLNEGPAQGTVWEALSDREAIAQHGCTPMGLAVQGEVTSVQQAFVQRLLDVDPRLGGQADALGNTPLMGTASLYDDETTLLNLLLPVSDVMAKNHKGWSVLHEAARHDNPSALVRLLPLFTTVEPYKNGITPLMIAAGNGSFRATQSLLNEGNPLTKDDEGLTALMHAVDYGDMDIVQILLPVSDVKAMDNRGCTVLQRFIDSRSRFNPEQISPGEWRLMDLLAVHDPDSDRIATMLDKGGAERLPAWHSFIEKRALNDSMQTAGLHDPVVQRAPRTRL